MHGGGCLALYRLQLHHFTWPCQWQTLPLVTLFRRRSFSSFFSFPPAVVFASDLWRLLSALIIPSLGPWHSFLLLGLYAESPRPLLHLLDNSSRVFKTQTSSSTLTVMARRSCTVLSRARKSLKDSPRTVVVPVSRQVRSCGSPSPLSSVHLFSW